MPSIGLGTWKMARQVVGGTVVSALQLGYRHIDCAPVYNNEREVGEALESCFRSGLVKREEVWITSKLWNNAHHPRHVRPALERSLKDLRLDYLDLYLIHWPVHFRQDIMFPKTREEFLDPGEIPILDTWQALEKLVRKGLCRYIGVCNFTRSKLQRLLTDSSLLPLTNQVELHPLLPQADLVSYCLETGIVPTAYSPLGSGDRPQKMKRKNEPELLCHPVVVQQAKRCGVSPACLLLGWARSRGCTVIPKASSANHLRENLLAATYVPDPVARQVLDSLDCGHRFVDGVFFTGKNSPYTMNYLWDE